MEKPNSVPSELISEPHKPFRDLVAKWRGLIDSAQCCKIEAHRLGMEIEEQKHKQVEHILTKCVDELETALEAAAPAGTPDEREHNLEIMLRYALEGRCAVCGWPVAKSANEGCVQGNCSMRPQDSPFRDTWLRRAKLAAALATPSPQAPPSIELAVRKLEETSIAIHDLPHESRGGFQWVKTYDALKIIADSQRELLATQPLKEGISERAATQEQPAGSGASSNEHELLVGGIVRAALELAILRGDLRMDSGDAFEEMSEREDVITDTWNAMNGEGTCDDEPVKELKAIYVALGSPRKVGEDGAHGALREALRKIVDEYDKYLAGPERLPTVGLIEAIAYGGELLSLSSPIEPWPVEHKPNHCPVCGGFPVDANEIAAGVAKLRAQASSEIRELTGDILRTAMTPIFNKHASAWEPFPWEECAIAVRSALAPSRQGAAKRVEG